MMQARDFEIPLVQSFVTHHETGMHVNVSGSAQKKILSQKRNIDVYIHGSYKINLASDAHAPTSAYFLKKELLLAQKLEARALVLHPGSREVDKTREQALETIAKNINALYKKTDYPTLLLENVAFANRCLGGSLEDLALIRSYLDKPEKVQFCIDTAHAFSFGYNLANIGEQSSFIAQLDAILGIDSIALLHVNDTNELCGSQHDRHEIPGNGQIGAEALAQFIAHKRLKHIPCIVELPQLEHNRIKEIITMVTRWRLKT
jgi:deoxyribonuclease-4